MFTFDSSDVAGIFAIVLSLSIPIVAIVMGIMSDIKKKQRDTELRLALIQAGTDAETTKALLKEQEKKPNKFITLRWGCVLAGAGLGALCNGLAGVSSDDIYFWIAIAAGMGLGLLIAFIIEYKLTKKDQQTAPQQEQL